MCAKSDKDADKNANAQSSARERILATARRFFYEQGFEETTFNVLCARADVNPNTLAYHFGSKLKLGQLIYTSALAEMEQQLRELFPEKDDAEILFLSVCVHQRLLFEDPCYRRFSCQMIGSGTKDFAHDHYEHFIPLAYRFLKGSLDDEQVRFYLAAIAGADSQIEPYISEHIDELSYEKSIRYTLSVYGFFLDQDVLAPLIDAALVCIDSLEVVNVGFDVRVRIK